MCLFSFFEIISTVCCCYFGTGRPIGTTGEKGCQLANDKDENPSIDIGESISLPVSVIDSGKVRHLVAHTMCKF